MDGGTCMAPPCGCSGRSRQSEWVARVLHDGLGPMERGSIAQLTRPRQHGRDLAPAHAAPSAVLGARGPGGALKAQGWLGVEDLSVMPKANTIPTAPAAPIEFDQSASHHIIDCSISPKNHLSILSHAVAPCYARPRPWRRPGLTLLFLGKRWPSSAVAALESLPCGP